MKTFLIMSVLFTLIPSLIYSQDKQAENDYIRSVEFGAGTGDLYDSFAAINVGLSNGLGKYMATFIDYNLYLDNSKLENHEISVKAGPCLQFNNRSYMALSTGFAAFLDINNSNGEYVNGMLSYRDNYFICVPIQAKVNMEVANGICLGFKGTLNKVIDKKGPDMTSLFVVLAYSW